MPNKTFNDLTIATTSDGTELIPLVSSGTTKTVSVSNINSGISIDTISDVYDSRDIAQGQSSIASAAALAAGSISQQDLTAVSTKLHRSPNAISSMFIYDTSKDSDNGAWTQKCQHTSWYNEGLSGKWLGTQDSEPNARYAGGTFGPNLLSNGTFESTTSWQSETDGGGPYWSATIENNTLKVTTLRVGLSKEYYTTISTQSGKVYQLTLDILGVQSAALQIRANGQVLQYVSTTTLPKKYTFYFIASSSNTNIGFGAYYGNGARVGDYIIADNISCKEITTIANSGDYFQLTTDGKFYQISKNLLTSTATLPNQTQWLAAGTYTISSTTALSGSIAITGAATATHTAGTPTTFIVATSGNVTFTVTGSVLTAQLELGSVVTAYQVNGTARTVETFRGNKRDFPKLAAIVASGSGTNQAVDIYDLTEPGRPMWMRIAGTSSNIQLLYSGGTSVISVSNAMLAIGAANTGLIAINFVRESATRYSTNQSYTRWLGNGISERGSKAWALGSTLTISNSTVNDIAMTVMPDAPTDPVTGLKVPTIAVATAGGVSVIKHDGTVVRSSSTLNYSAQISLTKGVLATGRNTDFVYAINPGSLGASFILQTKTQSQPPDFSNGNTTGVVILGKSEIIRRSITSGLIQKLKINYGDISKSLALTLTNTYNTGYMTGDIRRAYLSDTDVGSVSNPATVADRSYKAGAAAVTGTLTKTAVAAAAQLVAYSGFSATNYLQEPYSADLDFGTGEWSASAWVSVPTTLPVENFSTNGPERISGGNFENGLIGTKTDANGSVSAWTLNTDNPISGTQDGRLAITVGTSSQPRLSFPCGDRILGKVYELSFDYKVNSGSVVISQVYNGSGTVSVSETLTGIGTFRFRYAAGGNSSTIEQLYFGDSLCDVQIDNVSSKEVASALIADRAYSSGAFFKLGVNALGRLEAIAFDGTATRTTTTTTAYNTGTWIKAETNYRSGRLSILVNGIEVAVTTGSPLLSLNNSGAVLTIGNSYNLDKPFPGSLALLKLSATVPTPEQSIWMYEQEKQMFRDNAQITLPDSTAINDLAYDDQTDRWIAISNTNKSTWSGLVRVASESVPSGAFSKTVASSGIQLSARTTTDPGVDITIPMYNIKSKIKKKAEKSKSLSNSVAVYDFTPVVFTNATLTYGSNIMTCSTVSGTPYIGMGITGTGISAGMTIIGINGTSYYLSSNYTGTTGSAYTVGQSTFTLPTGYTSQLVYSNGTLQREGATKSYIRAFDGFRETVSFLTSPGISVVQIHAIKA